MSEIEVNDAAQPAYWRTLMMRTEHFEFVPSEEVINPFVKVVTHKTRAFLDDVKERDKHRRPLSALLAG